MVASVPEVTVSSVEEVRHAHLERVRYRIPGDIDVLMRHDPDTAVHWRQEMRRVLGALMTTRAARVDDGAVDEGPIAVGMQETPGAYVVTGFATGHDPAGERESYYVLERRSAG